PSPQPPSFLPARAFSFCRAKRGNQSEFCSKKVRASFSNCDRNGFLFFFREGVGDERKSIQGWSGGAVRVGVEADAPCGEEGERLHFMVSGFPARLSGEGIGEVGLLQSRRSYGSLWMVKTELFIENEKTAQASVEPFFFALLSCYYCF
ncbi:MAG: hypothetical protein U1C49_02845, partial [Candidatus Andersenbacteria bacterium]|nr:hypothetical protein [Candidatus Andersenbacteria bacterium]